MPIINLVSPDSRLLQTVREAGLSVVPLPPEGLHALAEASAPQPALVILDCRERGPLPPVLTALKRAHPATGVLLIVTQLEPALMLEAMRAGVNELLTVPIVAPELHAAVLRLTGSLAAVPNGEVFAVIGARGGVGATTVAVNLAAALAKHTTEPTLLVDLNVAYGDAAVFLDADPRFSVVDALENVQRLDPAFFNGLVIRTAAGLDLLAASTRPVTAPIDAPRLRALLEFVSRTYRFAVLDVPRADAAALDALDSAARIILVANQELSTVRSAARIAAGLRQRYGDARLGLVLTRTDRRAEIGHDDVERTVGIEISHTIPSDYRLALAAMNKGRPLVLDRQGELAKAFTAVARSIAGRQPADAAAAPADRLFGRLTLKKA